MTHGNFTITPLQKSNMQQVIRYFISLNWLYNQLVSLCCGSEVRTDLLFCVYFKAKAQQIPLI